MTVQKFMKIVQTVFKNIETFMKRSEDRKNKKKHEWISSQKFFRLLLSPLFFPVYIKDLGVH